MRTKTVKRAYRFRFYPDGTGEHAPPYAGMLPKMYDMALDARSTARRSPVAYSAQLLRWTRHAHDADGVHPSTSSRCLLPLVSQQVG